MNKLFFFTFFFGFYSSAYSKENFQYFESTDSPAKLIVLNLDGPHSLLKLEGATHKDADRVYMFTDKKDSRFSPLNGATNMLLIDNNKKTIIQGTMKKVWTLAGLDHDMYFEEKAAPNSLDVSTFKKEYETAEGAGDYNNDIAQIIQNAELNIEEKCNVTITVKHENLASKDSPPAYKAMAAINGLTQLCADPDYLAALKEIKTIIIKGKATGSIDAQKKGKSIVTLSLPKDSQNTAPTIKKILMKKL
jgi:hypothetical protein